MADPFISVAERLAPAFAAVAGGTCDPVVRPSDRADGQANGALALAKKLGLQPREVAQQVLDAAGDVSDMLASTEIAGPGFINLVFSNAFIAEQSARRKFYCKQTYNNRILLVEQRSKQ
jgi:arginyl-tRNA synthetase